MKMKRTPTYAGKARKKDELDILYWATQRTAVERLVESWRLHCANHNVDPVTVKIDKTAAKASKRS